MKNYKELVICHKLINKKKDLIFYNSSNYIKYKKNTKKSFVGRPYGLTSREIKSDHRYLFNSYKFFLKIISNQLNYLHKTNKDIRYWEIIIGHWLRTFLWTVYNRYKTINQIKLDYLISPVKIYNTKNINLTTKDTFDFNIVANNEYFNSLLLSKIIEKLRLFKYSYTKKTRKFFFSDKNKIVNTKKSQIKEIFNFDSSNVYFMDTYIPPWPNLALKIFVNKRPSFFSDIVFNKKYTTRLEKKKRSFNLFGFKHKDRFYYLISKIIGDFLPMSFIENYKLIKNEVTSKNSLLPQKIKTIFTSNSFGKKDNYNIWIAEKVFNGAKYIVGQHGSGYLESYDKFSRIEFRTCDKFIAWGNQQFSKKIFPLFNFRAWKKKIPYKNNKNILFVTRSVGTQITHYDRWSLGNEIFSKTEKIINKINVCLQKKIILKLHSNYKKNIYPDFDSFLKKNINKDFLVSKNISFYDLLKKTKLVVFNDYSTGFLECLSLDFPSICFFPSRLDFIHSKNKKDFLVLKKNNLIFFNEWEIANFINSNHEYLNDWWNSPSIKKVKHNFCIKYSKSVNTNFLVDLKKFSSII
jgi:putative transferase (TIGR04331 family)